MTYNRRDFIKSVPALGAAFGISNQAFSNTAGSLAIDDRKIWNRENIRRDQALK